jgi:hypothetical protein
VARGKIDVVVELTNVCKELAMPSYDSLDDLRNILTAAGHKLVETGATALRVSPSPDSGIVVATQPDVTLYQAYRRRFFLCGPGSEAILSRENCPTALRLEWDEVLLRMDVGQSRDLLAGPGAWTLARLHNCDPILIWGVGPAYWEQSYCDSQYELIENALGRQIEFSPWRTHLIDGTSQNVYQLSPHSAHFAYVLAAYFLLSSYNFFEFYLADIACTEVYEIHHHDKVTISSPMPGRQQQTLRILAENPDLYIVADGYHCGWDEEGEQEENRSIQG